MDHQLLQKFTDRLKTNEAAMKVMMSEIIVKCDMDSTACINMSKILAKHEIILKQLGEIPDKKNTKYVVRKNRSYKHR